MIFQIVTGVMLGLMTLIVLGGALKGRKYAWQYTALRLVNVVVSAIIAAIASAFLGNVLGNLISTELIKVLPEEIAEVLKAMPSASGLIAAFIVMFSAPALFYLIFAIVRGIIGIFVPFFAFLLKKITNPGDTDGSVFGGKKISKKKLLKTKKGGPIGMILGAVCSLILFVVLLAPLTAYVTIANGVMMMVPVDNEVVAIAADVTDALAENPGTKAVKTLGGDALVAKMTSYELAENESNLIDETEFITAIGEAVEAVNDDSVDRAEAANFVREVGDAFGNTKFIPAAIAELLDIASDSWSEGEDFVGIKAPSMGEDSEKLTEEICATFDNSTIDTVKKDACTIANIIACIVEAEAFDDVKGDFVSILENEDVTQKVLFELLDNDHLYGMVGGLMNYGVDILCNSLDIRQNMEGVYNEFLADLEKIEAGTDPSDEEAIANAQTEYEKLFDKYGIKVSDADISAAAIADANGADMVAWLSMQKIIMAEADFIEKSVIVTADDIKFNDHVITDKAVEAVKLAKALHSVVTLSEQLKGSNKDTVTTVMELGPVLDAFADTETVGADCTSNLLVAVLQSDKVSKNVGFDHIQATEIAESINKGANNGGYTSQMKTLGQTVDVLQVVSNKGDSKEAVSTLLKDLTPETAKTIQTVTTPTVMKENGVPEKSAETASSMMSDMLGGLADAKEQGMTDEQLDKETVAVNNILNTAMNIDSTHESVFGEDSATGVTANQYVNDMMESKVVSQTIIDHVYGEGDTPKLDPLNSERVLTESETNELVNALNDKWQNASSEEKSDPNFDKSIVALAALINVQVNITSNGVVKAA